MLHILRRALENVESIKYLGVTITHDLRWNRHVSNICTKANRELGFLKQNISACPQDVKEMVYKESVHPVLEYASSVWGPSSTNLQYKVEKVQNHGARLVTRNFSYETGSMTDILEQLKWESLEQRRTQSRLILIYKDLKGRASILTDDLVHPEKLCQNMHPMAFQTLDGITDIYKFIFSKGLLEIGMGSLVLLTSLLSSAEVTEDLPTW